MSREKLVALCISLAAGAVMTLAIVYGLDATYLAIQDDLAVAALEAGSFSEAPTAAAAGGSGSLSEMIRVVLGL